MVETTRPRIRPHLQATADPKNGQFFIVSDQLRLSHQQLHLSQIQLEVIQLFDGQHTLGDIQAHVKKRTGGQVVPLHVFSEMVAALDSALFLEGHRFREAAEAPVRPPSCIGCYPGEATALRAQFKRMFTSEGASGRPGDTHHDPSFRGILAPHIDYARGGLSYTWPFKELVERSAAKLFVIIGTSHYSGERFTLTRKHFKTPLGIVQTEGRFIDELTRRYGDGLFDDELMAHLPEHSIELEVVLLQYLLEGKRDFRIVPLVVGSYHDCVVRGTEPSECSDIERMIEALRAVEAETKEPICYIISGDLAHIGPKFDDPEPVARPFLDLSRKQDLALIDQASAADAQGYFRIIADEQNARRICGLPPTYLALKVARPASGKLLHYDQYVHPRGFESVSFASMAFYQ